MIPPRSRKRQPSVPPLPLCTWSWEEVRTQQLVVVDNRVYDVRAMMADHPSGGAVIARHLGHDITAIFNKIHRSARARTWLESLCVGSIQSTE